ncbi:MAG: biopolymer transport protein TolQ [Kiritimatiellia bacterium]|jgi:biopolymer transport protein TolQ
MRYLVNQLIDVRIAEKGMDLTTTLFNAGLHLHTGYLWQSFKMSDSVGKLIIVILIFGSIMAWSIMVSKYLELKQAHSETRRFLIAFRGESHPLGVLEKHVKFTASPLYKVYVKACDTLGRELKPGGFNPDSLFVGGLTGIDGSLSELKLESIGKMAECKVAEQALVLEENMGWLATAASAAPFLGLLGTVWGVMGAFTGMAVTGSASISAVAPGVASALATTVVGLIVALPSAVGYNILSHRIRVLSVAMDNFAQEFVAEIQRVYTIRASHSTAQSDRSRSDYKDEVPLEETLDFHGA